MNQQINRNILWCRIFVNTLSDSGIRNVCISPGSRSTPLTLSFSMNKKFKIYPIVDERSSAYFALGLAKKTKTPTAIVTTSGTAVAEIYPAIIEAYYQRIPLIVCTADRPAYLRNRGANQTINQYNIYKNHIRFFYDTGLPQIDRHRILMLIKNSYSGIKIAKEKNPGPVHFNFPFEKPFEPDAYTDKVDTTFLNNIESERKNFVGGTDHKEKSDSLKNIYEKIIEKRKKGIIVCGYNNFGKDFKKSIVNFSEKYGYPIFADGASGLRYGNNYSKNIIENYNSLIRSELFCKRYDPEIIFLVGGAPTSNQLHDFIKNSKAEKFIINEYGDKNDPTLTAKKIIKENPISFFKNMERKKVRDKNDWSVSLQNLNSVVNKFKKSFFGKLDYSFESLVVTDVIDLLPKGCNLMISNSLPIRDIDFFSDCLPKEINVYTNRGASGIDGINSTALGIASKSNEPTFLITGDLAFYHDLTGLHNSIRFKIPITIILINNKGGGIFHSLPISRFGEIFNKNFLTPLKLDFKKIVKAFNGNYYLVNNKKKLEQALKSFSRNKSLNIIEIKTNAKTSSYYRTQFWKTAVKEIDSYLNEHQS